MDPADAELATGQIWSYRTRRGEEGSQVIVDLVYTVDGLGEVVHARLDGLHVPNPVYPDLPSTELPHFPITADALRPSLVALVGHRTGAPDLSGYEEWRAAEGGYFTVSPAEVAQLAEDAIGGGVPEDPS